MNRVECPQEALVVEAVLTGAWPQRADEALVAHAHHCDICRDVAAIATLMHDDSERARYEVQVPAAGQVWWRSAIRARLESTEVAARPMTWMHAITGAVAAGVLLAMLTAAWPMLAPLTERLWLFAAGFFPTPEVAAALAGSLRTVAIFGAIGAAILVLGPLVLYFVLADD